MVRNASRRSQITNNAICRIIKSTEWILLTVLSRTYSASYQIQQFKERDLTESTIHKYIWKTKKRTMCLYNNMHIPFAIPVLASPTKVDWFALQILFQLAKKYFKKQNMLNIHILIFFFIILKMFHLCSRQDPLNHLWTCWFMHFKHYFKV